MDFSKVKLRPTQTKAAPVLAETICNGDEDYHRLMRETYLESYMDVLHDITFKVGVVVVLVSLH